jgi:hypothetical protein
MVALAEVAEISGGITKNAKRSALPIQRPYLSVANVHFNRIDTNNLSNIGVNEAELARAQLMPGDLMVVEGNGSLSQLGRVAIWHGQVSGCLHQNHLIKVRPKPTVKSKWLLYWLMSSAGREAIEATASSTSGLHTLSLAKVGSLPAPIASLEEQEAAIAYIDLHLSRLDEAITTLQGIQAKLKQARASILKAAVEGRLVETEAELADQSGKSYEHANQQLERIGLEFSGDCDMCVNSGAEAVIPTAHIDRVIHAGLQIGQGDEFGVQEVPWQVSRGVFIQDQDEIVVDAGLIIHPEIAFHSEDVLVTELRILHIAPDAAAGTIAKVDSGAESRCGFGEMADHGKDVLPTDPNHLCGGPEFLLIGDHHRYRQSDCIPGIEIQ